jgi:hypothetical protein
MVTTVVRAQTVRDEGLAQKVQAENLAKAAATLGRAGIDADATGTYDESSLIEFIHQRGWMIRINGADDDWGAEVMAEVSPEEDWFGVAADTDRVTALALALAALLRAPWPEREPAARVEAV